MRLPGWCERCHQVRQVRVSGAGMARLAHSNLATGVCTRCEEEERGMFCICGYQARNRRDLDAHILASIDGDDHPSGSVEHRQARR